MIHILIHPSNKLKIGFNKLIHKLVNRKDVLGLFWKHFSVYQFVNHFIELYF